MSVRLTLTEHVLAQPYALAPGRLTASVAALLGLAGVIIGGLALARSAGRRGTGRREGVVALLTGVVGLALGALVAATADGGVGTGNGLGGAYVALVVGLIGVILGGLLLARSRRTG